ncbi:type I-E CRISPR-associated protein Cas5/CasD [uncultured Ruminococcus sp.]|uniref:type I-E CRISPR-associated protein Cas5/CasD n=1 Tax=uncultured Ruminococcus sp. TaxID=165186 RepID=UPI0026650EB6|nr:type I-E CRISPR-associated protein Cas5/CasD [uncultured Ruminococcus sp.]
MAVLLLRLAAPLQAWGRSSKFIVRSTEREPTKSGVIGMIAAAMGIQRNDDAKKLAPLAQLRFGVRADKEGILLKDFHMVHGYKIADVTERYYLSDAVFLAVLECDDKKLLEEIAAALQKPVYPLYLGRKSCPPTLPVVLGVKDEDMLTALKNEPFLYENDRRKNVRISYEVSSGGAMVQDVPLSFSQLHRKHGWRMKREELFIVDKNAEHDAFSEL